jgi:phage replication O-like protein O
VAKRNKESFTPFYNTVLECMAKVQLKPTEYQFLFALWRFTWGMKNKPGKETGKYTTWNPQKFMDATGLDKTQVGKIKRSLLEKKVLIKKDDRVGFNRHVNKWSKQTTPKSRLNRPLKSSDQTTKVVQLDDKKSQQPSGSTDAQSLKKERKKEIYSERFLEVWKRYPKGTGKFKAWEAYKSHVIKNCRITHDKLVDLLEKRLPEMLAKIKEDGHDQYIKACSVWINSRPWDDDRSDSPHGVSLEESKERLIYLNTKRRKVKLRPDEYQERIDLETLMRSKKS